VATIYKIHPAIGTARVGNSDEYYLATETPGGLPLDPVSGKPIYVGPGAPSDNVFHDSVGALKKQGARFKVFVYDNANPNGRADRALLNGRIALCHRALRQFWSI
jgi:hypothetical protein